MNLQTAVGKKHVFETLDGMRGIAAICVAFMHAQMMFRVWPYSGFLAVDFFFVLSGFVISYAYEERLKTGLSPLRFALIRLIRLYPLYILGVALALGERMIGAALHLGPAPTLDQAIAWPILETLFLPVPAMFHPEANHLFPGLFPAWSLFFELIINIVYGFVGRYLTNSRLIAVVAIGGMLLIEQIVVRGSVDHGGSNADYMMSFARVVYSFFAGIGIKRLYFSGKIHLKIRPMLCFPALLALLFLPTTGLWVATYQAVCVLLIFPALVLVFAFARAHGFERRVLLQLGILSYPIYILHAPIIFLITRVQMHFHSQGPASSLVGRLLFVLALSAGPYLAYRYYDLPARNALARKFLYSK